MTDTIRSMTGFGTAPFEVAGARYRISVRSVNHRNLNIRYHLPSGFTHSETAIKRVLRDRVVRGSVDVSVSLEDTSERPVNVVVDQQGAATMKRALDSLAETLDCEAPGLEWVLRQGDFVSVQEAEVEPDALTDALTEGLGRAVDRLDGTRLTEGAELAADIQGRLATLEQLTDRIEEAAPAVYAAFEARLRQRLEEAMARLGQPVDEGRIASELVVFSDRCDVTEETVRTRAHITAFGALLAGARTSDGASEEVLVGKRCEFLTQELGREFNTIGSKCRDAGMASDVVDAKVELERIREQVQNIA
ncbi:MAG: YicC/YloC family endoribonuclease [Myxococcota bacterium]|jgi:uncharacterized protein (TIGR00255 family)|nr:YicC/YloC family endoribonuclease [Myxococcota bacterium]